MRLARGRQPGDGSVVEYPDTRPVDHAPFAGGDTGRCIDPPHPFLVSRLAPRPFEEIPGEDKGILFWDGFAEARAVRDRELTVGKGKRIGTADPGAGVVGSASPVGEEPAPAPPVNDAPAKGDG